MHKSDDSGSYPDQKAKLLSVPCYAPRILLLCDFVRNGSMLLCARVENGVAFSTLRAYRVTQNNRTTG